MYIPKLYENTCLDEIERYVSQYSFGAIVHQAKQLQATHLPFLVKREENCLVIQSHISVANDLKDAILQNKEVLLIFQGPHTYISSSWYDHENVPTYNYIAVHIYGQARALSSEDTMIHLSELMKHYETSEPNPLAFETLSDELLTNHLPGLIAFEVKSTLIKSAFKLSQNRDLKNKDAIIRNLQARGDEHSLAVAQAMQNHF